MEPVIFLSVVRVMEIPVVVSWDCGFDQVWLKVSRREVEVKERMIRLWMVCSTARLFEDQETKRGAHLA